MEIFRMDLTPSTPREPGTSSFDGYGTVNEERMPDTSDDEEVLLPEVCFFLVELDRTWLKLKLYKMSILQSIVIVCESFDMSSLLYL